MSKELIILPDQYGQRGALFFLSIASLLAFLFWRCGGAGSAAIAAFSFAGIVGLGGLITFETRISQEKLRFVRVWTLAGVLPIWKQFFPFASLQGVQQWYSTEGEHDMWRVGLVTSSGRFLMVTYFSSRTLKAPLEEAERFGMYLAGLLGLPVLEAEKEV